MSNTTEQQLPAKPQSRNGKIARLPRAIRDDLNRRLHDGETAVTLLPWLNAHPAVQPVLAAQFGSRPVNAENLSQWRNGGFQDWLHHEEELSLAQSILEDSASLTTVSVREDAAAGDDCENSPAGLPLSDRLSAVAALALAKIIRSLSRGDLESPASQKALLNTVRTLNWLRRSDHQAIRLKMDLLRWEEEKAGIHREAVCRAALAVVCKQPPPIESRIVDPLEIAQALRPPSPPAPQPRQSGAPVPGAFVPSTPSAPSDPSSPSAPSVPCNEPQIKNAPAPTRIASHSHPHPEEPVPREDPQIQIAPPSALPQASPSVPSPQPSPPPAESNPIKVNQAKSNLPPPLKRSSSFAAALRYLAKRD